MPKKMTTEEYLKADGCRCPDCRSSNIQAGRLDHNFPLTQEVTCQDCGAVWTDTYKLTGYENLHKP